MRNCDYIINALGQCYWTAWQQTNNMALIKADRISRNITQKCPTNKGEPSKKYIYGGIWLNVESISECEWQAENVKRQKQRY